MSKDRDVLTGEHFLNGDDACAEGAIAAGCRFFAGYPITPATEIAERMRQAISSEPIVHNGLEHRVTATVGVATVGEDRDFDAALRRADSALYQGKQAGRNCVRANSESDAPASPGRDG